MTTETTAEQRATAPVRRWWQTLPFIVLVGVLPPPFGLFFLGFIAIALLLSDATRESEVRAGGGVLLFWWTYSFRQGDTSPYVGVVLLAIAAVLLARGARRRLESGGPRAAWGPLGGAVLAAVLGVVVLVPYGYREPEVTREAAAERVFAERGARSARLGTPTDYLVEGGRLRIVHKPVWYVVVYERHATIARTRDDQPCFAQREVWRVDALNGSVARATYDDAAAGEDPCLPIRLGTEEDLKPAPPA